MYKYFLINIFFLQKKKAPLYTPSVTGYTSRNVKLRQSLNLFAQIVPIKSVQGN